MGLWIFGQYATSPCMYRTHYPFNSKYRYKYNKCVQGGDPKQIKVVVLC